MSIQSALTNIKVLGIENSTSYISADCETFVNEHSNELQQDYKKTSRKTRYSSGYLEKPLFLYLAFITRWSTKRNVCKRCSKIMDNLGYHSYLIKPKRYKQKVENEKKKLRRMGRSLEDASYISGYVDQPGNSYEEPNTTEDHCDSLIIPNIKMHPIGHCNLLIIPNIDMHPINHRNFVNQRTDNGLIDTLNDNGYSEVFNDMDIFDLPFPELQSPRSDYSVPSSLEIQPPTLSEDTPTLSEDTPTLSEDTPTLSEDTPTLSENTLTPDNQLPKPYEAPLTFPSPSFQSDSDGIIDYINSENKPTELFDSYDFPSEFEPITPSLMEDYEFPYF